MLVPDEHIIVRGGQSPLPEPGTEFSGAHGATLDEAAAAVPHGVIRATTAGAIRAQGGAVGLRPEAAYPGGPINGQHVHVTEGLEPTTFSEPFPNPIPKSDRISGR